MGLTPLLFFIFDNTHTNRTFWNAVKLKILSLNKQLIIPYNVISVMNTERYIAIDTQTYDEYTKYHESIDEAMLEIEANMKADILSDIEDLDLDPILGIKERTLEMYKVDIAHTDIATQIARTDPILTRRYTVDIDLNKEPNVMYQALIPA